MKKFIFIILSHLIMLPVYCDKPAGEISIWGAGGLSTLHYKLSAGTVKPSTGWDAGISYTTFLSKNWGYGLGLELSRYGAESRLKDYSETYKAISSSIPEGNESSNEFEFSTHYTGLKEKQEATYLNIPVFLQYRNSEAPGFYFNIGAKIGFPIKAVRKTSAETLNTSGYFAYENIHYTNLPEYGFYSIENYRHSTSIDMNLNLMVFIETGVRYRLSKRINLYTGIYAGYGFNNLYPHDKKPLLLYQHDGNNIQNSLWDTYRNTENGTKPVLSSRVSPITLGIKIKLAINLGIQKNK